MKKIYTIFSVVLILVFSGIQVNAQSTCPNPGGTASPVIYTSGCFVYINGTMPNADIIVYENLTNITVGASQTNSDGVGVSFYECGHTITRVLLTKPDGSVCEISGDKIAAAAILPIKLSSFNGSMNGDATASLRWVSQFELNSDRYVIQKSVDGKTFNDIGTVPASGNSVSPVTYNFSDALLGSGSAFYRLKMVDEDGTFDYSRVVYINNSKTAGTLAAFPNPFTSEIQLLGVNATDVNTHNVHLYSITGKEIGYHIIGANAISVDPTVPRGIYFLRVGGQSFKLVKD